MNLFIHVLSTVWGYLRADWMILLFGILLAVAIRVYVDPAKLRRLVKRNHGLSIPGSVVFGSFTPLCACGTMAVLLSMFASSLPWGPVMAFLVSSPLTSPSEYMFQTAFLGSPVAIAVLTASVVMGLSAGWLSHILETRTSFFDNQFRFGDGEAGGVADVSSEAGGTAGCGASRPKMSLWSRLRPKEFVYSFVDIGLKKILLYFILFIAIGAVVERLIPERWILALFSDTKSYSIPLAAVLGLPLHISGAASLPLLKSFANVGAGEGAILAFLIAGKATGIPVIAGMSTFVRARAMVFYVGFVLLSAILAGFIYEFVVGGLAWF